MTDNNHPITPPPELVAQIRSDALHRSDGQLDYELRLIHAGYCAGADQELEACCEWLDEGCYDPYYIPKQLRAARRPKPPSLADEALEQLRGIEACVLAMHGGDLIDDVIHAALKRLKELEDKCQ